MNNLVNMSMNEKGKCLPLEIRLQMYDDVIELRKQGLKYKEIQRELYEKYGKQLPISTISYWVNRKYSPFGRLNKFDEKPSPELAHVIGVILSDGSKFSSGKNYGFELSVIDKEFVETFGVNLAKILKRDKPYKPYRSQKLKRWTIMGRSILLYKFLDKPLRELKPYIEYSMDCVAKFLMALFDGEGSIYMNKKRYRRELKLYNTNEELLNYVKYLLKEYFDINTTGPHLNKKNDKDKATKNCYYLYIRAKSLLNFYKYIGFTIKRKQQRLIEAIQKQLLLPLPSFFSLKI